MTVKGIIAITLICSSLSSGLTWYIQDLRTIKRLNSQTIAYSQKENKFREELSNKFFQHIERTKDEETKYQERIRELESQISLVDSINRDLGITVSRLRDNERSLQTRLLNLSCEATREYASAATTAVTELSAALEREQRASVEASTKAEQYWLGWKTLDNAWDSSVTKEGK